MDIHLSIGQNHRFELREALLVYRSGDKSFITHHRITQQEQGPPTLGPAQPLTMNFIDSLLLSLRRNSDAEVLPENILAKGDRSIVWWTPRRERQMYYRSSQGECDHLDGKVFPQPPLVWRVCRGSLAVRALVENKRPTAKTALAFAPFWNLSNDGTVCLGSMRHPESTSVASIDKWEQGFYESAFTHGNVARITKHPEGFEGMWRELAGKKKPFPSDFLIPMPETLAQFVR